MTTVILDEALAERLKADRAQRGGDRYDEVWEGVYMMAAMPNNEHQRLVNQLAAVLEEVVGNSGLGEVFPGCNVSDREDWEENFRVPDVAVYLKRTTAIDRDTFWLGGPDFAIEIVSRGDKSREKFEFYAVIDTQEILIIDRYPWQLELHQLDGKTLQLKSSTRADEDTVIESETVGLTFSLAGDVSDKRPKLLVRHTASGKEWTI